MRSCVNYSIYGKLWISLSDGLGKTLAAGVQPRRMPCVTECCGITAPGSPHGRRSTGILQSAIASVTIVIMPSPLAQASVAFLHRMAAPSMAEYEPRTEQERMIEACADAIEEHAVLLAEAGTGTGKTFAYLIPAMLSGKRAVVSTRTINLQEQLVRKDLAFLGSLIDVPYAIAKGRANYLCLRRLNAFRPETEKDEQEYLHLLRWAEQTKSGDLEDFGFADVTVWDRVCSDADACKGRNCAYCQRCFYYTARRSWENARVIVANHALIAINGLLAPDARILPQTELLIIDEAHGLEKVLSDQIGIALTNRGFDYVLNRLLRHDERGICKGLLSLSPVAFPAVQSVRDRLAGLWSAVREQYRDRQTVRGRVLVEDALSAVQGALRALIEEAPAAAIGLYAEDDEIELKAALAKLSAYADAITAFLDEPEEAVRWTEIETHRIALRMAPLYPHAFMQKNLLPEYETVLFTSATLSVNGDFRFMRELLGIAQASSISLPSPFDLERQVQVEIVEGIDLRTDAMSFKKLADVIAAAAENETGGMLVLFTSRDAMRRVWDISATHLRALGRRVMMQGDEFQNRAMLEIMREHQNAVIFGLDSFWEGVDIRGDALRCLIITKLPFEVPTEPVNQARTEDMERQGKNAFMEYSLPRAVLKFKQGFGRLIRSRTDTGRVIICDERIRTKRYGRLFLESIRRTSLR